MFPTNEPKKSRIVFHNIPVAKDVIMDMIDFYAPLLRKYLKSLGLSGIRTVEFDQMYAILTFNSGSKLLVHYGTLDYILEKGEA